MSDACICFSKARGCGDCHADSQVGLFSKGVPWLTPANQISTVIICPKSLIINMIIVDALSSRQVFRKHLLCLFLQQRKNLFFTEICFVYRALSATISCERFGADAFFMSHSSSDLYEKINIGVPGIKTDF